MLPNHSYHIFIVTSISEFSSSKESKKYKKISDSDSDSDSGGMKIFDSDSDSDSLCSSPSSLTGSRWGSSLKGGAPTNPGAKKPPAGIPCFRTAYESRE